MTVEYAEKVYNRYSSFYDLVLAKVFDNGRGRDVASEQLDLFPGAQLLEVGVGTGLSLPKLPRNIQITGIDLSQKMLNQARRRIELLRTRHIQLFKMDAMKLEFPDNSFDRVFSSYFISIVPDPVQVVKEMRRVCRPAGYLVFVNHFRHEMPVIKQAEQFLSPLFYRLGFRTDLDLQELMEETGLRIDSVEKTGFSGHWKVVRCVNSD